MNVGQSVTQTVTLTNTGTAPLTLSDSLSGVDSGFSWTSDCAASLAAGASCGYQITFTPTTVGTFSKPLLLYDNAPSSPQTIALSGSAVTTSTITASPTGFDFGSQKVLSRGLVRTIQISNSTPRAVSIDSITVTGSDATDFTIANNCGNSLPAGGACSVYTVFSP